MRRLRDSRGAAMVEFAMVMPLLFILIFGIIDFGRYFSATSTVNTASRESARYGSTVGASPNGIPRFTDCAEIVAAGLGFTVAESLDATNYTVTYDHGSSNPTVFMTCPPAGPNPSAASFATADRIIVTVSTQFDFLTPLIGPIFGSVTLESTNRRSLLNL